MSEYGTYLDEQSQKLISNKTQINESNPLINKSVNEYPQIFQAYSQVSNPPVQKYSHDSYAADSPNISPLQQAKWQPSPTPPSLLYDPSCQILHQIQSHDTLQGLSLLYSVSISKLKQRNSLETDTIYYLKQLVIPNPLAQPLKFTKTREMILEQFIMHMPYEEKSTSTATYYLMEEEWDLQKAIQSFRNDLQWEKQNKMQLQKVNISQNSRLNYNQIELTNKKKL